ncbi:MAG: hypothetical protein ACXIVQ_11580 [Acidimicrobiales bacterium]
MPDREAHRPTRLARRATDQQGRTAPGWLWGGEPVGVAELREQLEEAQRRAHDAEAALPHLLALGQRTVNSLLTDARTRGRQIIEDAKAQAADEIQAQRDEVAREARELDSLRMAVAAEAMGLEQTRRELEQARVALDASRTAAALASGPSVEDADLSPTNVVSIVPRSELRAPMLPPPPSPVDLVRVGMAGTAGSDATPDAVSSRFADAWAAGEDEVMAEAFDRFFSAAVEPDLLRDGVLAPEAGPAGSDDVEADAHR